MKLPDIHLNISGSAIAFYGAVLSTVTGIVQVVHFFRDRVKVNITASPNMEMVGDPRYAGMTLVTLQVTNTGRRPVTITTMGAYRLHPRTALVVTDMRPRLPCELTEGKYVTALIGQDDRLDLANIEFWAAWDSAGRIHKLNAASWYKRWKSRRGRKAEAKKRPKAKAAQATRP